MIIKLASYVNAMRMQRHIRVCLPPGRMLVSCDVHYAASEEILLTSRY
jgi:hypothetical protein